MDTAAVVTHGRRIVTAATPQKGNAMQEMVAITGRTRWQTRWWLKYRTVSSFQTDTGWGGVGEFYCPTWAKPLDWLYSAIFGSTRIEPLP